MTPTRIAVTYAVHVGAERLDKILYKDRELLSHTMRNSSVTSKCLFGLLEGIQGVDDADYGAHEADITLVILAEYDTKGTWRDIISTIQQY